LPVSDFERVTSELHKQGYKIISEVDHPIALMAFFDTYQPLGVATQIMDGSPSNKCGRLREDVLIL
jgi:methylmalonyl-CoA/ethylmalonyl-CoA epimerase